MKTKLLLLVLALVMALCVLSACTPSEPAATTTDPGTSTTAAPDPDMHKVTFIDMEGHEISSVMVKDGEKVKKPETPACDESLRFVGWLVDGKDFNFNKTAITSDLYITAVFETKTFKVRFIVEDLEEDSQIISYGECATPLGYDPISSKDDGAEFVGWFAYQSETEYVFTTPVYQDTNLFAKFDYPSFTVRFFEADGTTQIGEDQAVSSGVKATAPASAPDLTAQHKDFIGWFDANGNRFDPDKDNYKANTNFIATYRTFYNVNFKLKDCQETTDLAGAVKLFDGKILANDVKVYEGMSPVAPVAVDASDKAIDSLVFYPENMSDWVISADTVLEVIPHAKSSFNKFNIGFSQDNCDITTDGSIRTYGTLFSKVGSYIECTTGATSAGPLVMYLTMDQAVRKNEAILSVYFSATLEIKIDGVVTNQIFYDETWRPAGLGGDWTVATLAPGAHTVRITLIDWEGFDEINRQEFSSVLPFISAGTYYADMSTVTHTVTFLDHEGNTVDSKNVKWGTTTTAPEIAPSIEGGAKVFEGWFDAAGVQFNPAVAVTADATYQARYSVLHTVTFVDAGGSTITSVKVHDGETASIPTDSNNYFAIAPSALNDLVNITEDKQITLEKVAKTGYASYTISTDNKNLDSSGAGFNPQNDGGTLAGYGCLFTKAGKSFSIEGNFAGIFKIRCALDKPSVNVKYHVEVDGVTLYSGEFQTGPSTTVNGVFSLCEIPAGNHVVKIVFDSLTGENVNINLVQIIVIAKK